MNSMKKYLHQYSSFNSFAIYLFFTFESKRITVSHIFDVVICCDYLFLFENVYYFA